jgi:hypothetical protein
MNPTVVGKALEYGLSFFLLCTAVFFQYQTTKEQADKINSLETANTALRNELSLCREEKAGINSQLKFIIDNESITINRRKR